MAKAKTKLKSSVADYENAAIGDNFRQIMEIVKLFGRFDFSKLVDIVSLLQEVNNTPVFKDKVKVGLRLLTLVAAATPTTTDDRVVELLNGIVTDPLLDVITRLVAGLSETNMHVQDVTTQATDRATALGYNIPWSFLVKLAIQLAEMLDGLNKS